VKVPQVKVPRSSYDTITVEVEAEVNRRNAKMCCWQISDLRDGDVVSFVWFGTAAKMAKLKLALKMLPQVDLAFLSKHSNVSKIEDAIRKAVGEEPAAGRKPRATPSKRRPKTTRRASA
jgi:hypothetical protein